METDVLSGSDMSITTVRGDSDMDEENDVPVDAMQSLRLEESVVLPHRERNQGEENMHVHDDHSVSNGEGSGNVELGAQETRMEIVPDACFLAAAISAEDDAILFGFVNTLTLLRLEEKYGQARVLTRWNENCLRQFSGDVV